ncbi:hypothetical protein [Streptomyces sp. NPDC059010]|uniref:hypothetical protein n=1 Tax=Streptomyces sp. NPDC059010 TaxID=3346695 RepID=UPI0036AC9244
MDDQDRPGVRPTPRVPDHPYGRFRDVLRAADGRTVLDSGPCSNVIVGDCRRLLAAFLRGAPGTTEGLVGLRVGAGLPAWDTPPGPPAPSPDQSALVDPQPHLVPRDQLLLDFVDPLSGAVTASPTRTLQIRAVLGPGVPPWPDTASGHTTGSLREFGLVARLNGTSVLINYRTHPAIAKDPASTLERTVWLTF